MFDLINGLPLHPLVVHAVVVLVPLSALGAIVIAVVGKWRRKYGHLVLIAAALATAMIPVATQSGEALEERVGDPGLHAELGDQLLWFAIPLLIAVAALVWVDRRRAAPATATQPDEGGETPAPTGSTTRRSPLVTVIAVVTVLCATASLVQVYRVGDSGARAAWGDQVSASSENG